MIDPQPVIDCEPHLNLHPDVLVSLNDPDNASYLIGFGVSNLSDISVFLRRSPTALILTVTPISEPPANVPARGIVIESPLLYPAPLLTTEIVAVPFASTVTLNCAAVDGEAPVAVTVSYTHLTLTRISSV